MKKSKFIFFTFLILGCSDSSVIERWADGSVKTKCFVDGNTKCYENYDETNQLIEEGCFYESEKNGKWITYHENGNVKMISHYQHGVLGGEYIRYSKGGNIEEKILYIDGFAEEKMKAFDNQSYHPTEEIRPQDSEYLKEYYDNGTLKSIGQMRNFMKIGEWKYFHSNGTLWTKGKYLPKTEFNVKEGIREDLELHFFPEEVFVKIGKWNIYGSNKVLRYKANYKLKNNKYTCRVVEIK